MCYNVFKLDFRLLFGVVGRSAYGSAKRASAVAVAFLRLVPSFWCFFVRFVFWAFCVSSVFFLGVPCVSFGCILSLFGVPAHLHWCPAHLQVPQAALPRIRDAAVVLSGCSTQRLASTGFWSVPDELPRPPPPDLMLPHQRLTTTATETRCKASDANHRTAAVRLPRRGEVLPPPSRSGLRLLWRLTELLEEFAPAPPQECSF